MGRGAWSERPGIVVAQWMLQYIGHIFLTSILSVYQLMVHLIIWLRVMVQLYQNMYMYNFVDVACSLFLFWTYALTIVLLFAQDVTFCFQCQQLHDIHTTHYNVISEWIQRLFFLPCLNSGYFWLCLLRWWEHSCAVGTDRRKNKAHKDNYNGWPCIIMWGCGHTNACMQSDTVCIIIITCGWVIIKLVAALHRPYILRLRTIAIVYTTDMWSDFVMARS